jgi:hypothetical protein
VASSAELAREGAALPTEPAPEAATRIRVDVAALLERAGEWLGENEARVVRVLLEGVEGSASVDDGDVVGEAELRWAALTLRRRAGTRVRGAPAPRARGRRVRRRRRTSTAH